MTPGSQSRSVRMMFMITADAQLFLTKNTASGGMMKISNKRRNVAQQCGIEAMLILI